MQYGSIGDEGKGCVCNCCTCGGDNNPEYALKKANWFYTGKFILFGLWCFLIYNTGSTWIGKIIKTQFTDDNDIEISLVCRTTASLAIWYAVHSILTVCNKNLVDSVQFMFHTSFMWLHTLVYFGLYIAFWFVPDEFFNVYIYICYFGSGLYLILQIYFLIDWFHNLNENLVEADRIGLMTVITAVLSILSIAGFGVEYWLFGEGESKSSNIAIITVNLVVVVLLFAASMKVDHGSILTSSLVAVYVAYLTFSGLSCEGGLINGDGSSSTGTLFSVLASVFTLCWAGYSAMSSSSQFNDGCTLPCSEDDGEERPSFSLSFFHFMFTLASIYLTMIVTHWANSSNTAVAWAVDRGSISKWINLAASWLTMLLYAWTLFAPLCFPDRDFGFK